MQWVVLFSGTTFPASMHHDSAFFTLVEDRIFHFCGCFGKLWVFEDTGETSTLLDLLCPFQESMLSHDMHVEEMLLDRTPLIWAHRDSKTQRFTLPLDLHISPWRHGDGICREKFICFLIIQSETEKLDLLKTKGSLSAIGWGSIYSLDWTLGNGNFHYSICFS